MERFKHMFLKLGMGSASYQDLVPLTHCGFWAPNYWGVANFQDLHGFRDDTKWS